MRFQVRARRREGIARVEKFIRQDSSPESLVAKLQAEGYLVLSIQDLDAEKKGIFGQAPKKRTYEKAVKRRFSEIALFEKVKGYELVAFFVQLIALLKAGVPILRSLSIIEQGLKRGLLKRIMQTTIARISQGFSLSNALAQYPKVFPAFWGGLIEAGEASGTLPEVLGEIQKYQETTEKFKRKLISAMVYPVILICFCIGAISIFMIKVIPTFEQVFKSFMGGKKLPQITLFVLETSRFLQRHYEFILIGVFVLGGLYAFMKSKRTTRKWLDKAKLQIPVLSTFLMEVAIVRFARGLGTMVRAGVPIIRSLEISSRLVGNIVIEDRVEVAKEDVKKGSSVAQALEKHEAFPVFVTQLVSVGEESGALEKFLDVIANFYEERVDATIQRLSVIIEPIIILFMGIVVGTLVISMFLPLIEISTGGH